jgi:hypothetical protein
MISTTVAGGWKYDAVSGQFIADDTNNDSNGTKYYLH